MNLNAFAKALVGNKIDLARAVEIINQVRFLMELVEEAADELKGSQKLQVVVTGVLGFIRYVMPDEAEAVVAEVTRKLAPVVSAMVTIYNILNLWPKPQGKL